MDLLALEKALDKRAAVEFNPIGGEGFVPRGRAETMEGACGVWGSTPAQFGRVSRD